MFVKLFLFTLSAIVIVAASPLRAESEAQRQTVPEVGKTLEVTPGQQFYIEFYSRPRIGYRVAQPFKSSMAGASGFPFSFAIDTVTLLPSSKSKDGNWQYFVPEGNKFRASHGLLGSVIRDGDTVGLRVRADGYKEWFVDNSVYNGFTTIWSRRVKDKDPALTPFETASEEGSGQPVQRLFFLGIANGQLRVRHEQISLDSGTTRDEFVYPIDQSGKSLVTVKGAEFAFEVQGSKGNVTVLKAMTSDFGMPVR